MSATTPNRDLVLVIDDEPRLIEVMRILLRDAGFDVLEAATVDAGVAHARSGRAAIAVIDDLLPDGTIIDILEALRSVTDMPVIVLSALRDENAKVEALTSGADDYVTKPVGARELVARIEAQLRRTPPQRTTTPLEIGGLSMNPQRRTAEIDGEPLPLTPLEWRLLQRLMRDSGRVLSHGQLIEAAWGSRDGADVRALRTTIGRLRTKLRPDPVARDFIVTSPGNGYAFKP